MKNLISILALIIMALTLTNCQCDDDADHSCICPEYFSPVCGEDGNIYSNECFANCAGVAFTTGFCPEEADGLVLDLGDPALDGCGWVVEIPINQVVMHVRPDTLAESWQVDSLAVRVRFKQTLETSPCGMIDQIPVIEVLQISQR